ncbi:MAG: G5 domain-containing protein [Clostridia bacterium]
MIAIIKSATKGVPFFKAKVSIVAIILILSTTITAFATSRLVSTTVVYDGDETTVVSFSQEAQEIIEKSGFDVSQYDEIDLDGFDIESEESVIEITKAYSVTIESDDEVVATLMVAGTVEDALDQAKVTLYDGDEINWVLSSEISQDITISIVRAFGVTLVCDGKSYSFDVSDCTVEDLLEMSNVTLGDNDIITHDLDTVLSEETVVTIKRVVYENYEEVEEIEYETVYQDSADLYEGETSVYQEGENGETTRTYKRTYVNGELTDSELITIEETKAVVNEIILQGTKQEVTTTVPTTVTTTVAATTQAATTQAATTAAAATTQATTTSDSFASGSNVISELTAPSSLVIGSDGIPTEYVDVITGPATAYYTGSTTSTGATVIPGRVAVDPTEIPYGSELYIVSTDGNYVYGYSIASDTGGFIYSSNTIVDLYMNTYSECINFGRRNVTIYVLSYG